MVSSAFTPTKVLEIFYIIDDFCKEIEPHLAKKPLPTSDKKRRKRAFVMSDSEIMTILVAFQLSQYRNLKAFYLMICREWRSLFPKVLSYNRFVERQKMVALKLSLFQQIHCAGKCTGFSIIDSTPIKMCHVKRSHRNKVFLGTAQKSKGTMGWYHGFKLHIIINDMGEIVEWKLTKSTTDDRIPLKESSFTKKIFGKLYADKGYISKSLFDELFVDGIHLVTKIRKNMKNQLMDMRDKIMLRKRSLVETVNDELKNIVQIEHTRHRSFDGFCVNLIAAITAYHFLTKKPKLDLEIIERERSIA